MTEERIVYAHVGGNGATEVTCQQHRTKNGCRRNEIQYCGDEREDCNYWKMVRGIAKLVVGRLQYLFGSDEFKDGVKEHEENDNSTHDPSSPES